MKNPSEEEELGSATAAGLPLVCYKHPDPGLAIHNAMTAAKAVHGTAVRVIDSLSVPPGNDPMNPKNAMDIIAEHLERGSGTLIAQNILHAFGDNKQAQVLIQKFATQTKKEPPCLLLVEDIETKVPGLLRSGLKQIFAKLPPPSEMLKEVKTFVKDYGLTLPGNGEMLYKIAAALSGVFRNKANDLMKECLAVMGTLDPMWLANRKAAMITDMSGGILSFMDAGDTEIGGLEGFMAIATRKGDRLISQDSLDFGCDTPKGFVLQGPAGTGKTLFGKAFARRFGLPLLRFDPSKVYGGHVGDSESNMALAIQAIDATAPNVVIIDEADKMFGGVNGPDGDSGTSKRVFGSFLTWLQERTAPAFLVMTGNNPTALPPEVTRPGRFDGTFFVGAPNEGEREAILNIHIGAIPNRKVDWLDVKSIAKRTEGWSGAELKALVKLALERAFSDRKATGNKKRDISMEDVEAMLPTITPNTVLRAEEYANLLKWARKNRIVSASTGLPMEAEASATLPPPATTQGKDGEFMRGSVSIPKKKEEGK